MDEKRIKELFQQTGETLQAILEYFRLKDKVLWTGSAGKGKTITVPNLSKYSLIRIKAVYGDFLVNTSAGSRNDRLQRESRSHQTDITDWGCAA